MTVNVEQEALNLREELAKRGLRSRFTDAQIDEALSRVVGGDLKTQAITVSSLPSATTVGAGSRSFVTDANATTFASVVAGGGANGVPVYSDGTDWRIG